MKHHVISDQVLASQTLGGVNAESCQIKIHLNIVKTGTRILTS